MVELTSAATFDCEDAVCVTREAGSLAGLVGDFGLGLIKPVAEIMGPGFFVVSMAEDDADGRLKALAGDEIAAGLITFFSEVLFSVPFDSPAVRVAGSLPPLPGVLGGLLGVVGVLGTAGDFLATAETLAVVIGAGLVVDFVGAVLSGDFVCSVGFDVL